MRVILTVGLCLVLCTCSSSPGVPLDIDAVRAALTYEIGIIATGINHEDPLLASQPVSPRFTMNENVAVRYHQGGWDGTGIGKYREFFAKVFTVHANIDQRFTIHDLSLNGEVAWVRVYNDFLSSRTDVTPPENYTAAGWDWLVFELDNGKWLLINWDEAPDPNAEPIDHDAGNGEDI